MSKKIIRMEGKRSQNKEEQKIEITIEAIIEDIKTY